MKYRLAARSASPCPANRRAVTCAAWALFAVAFQATTTARAADGPVEPVQVRAEARFGFDQSRLQPADQAALLREVGQMKGVTWQTVRAVGHTDSVGPDGYNRALSLRRAQAVKSYLILQGLAPDMIAAEGKASDAPRADNGTAEGRARNRRTEVVFEGIRAAAR